MTKNTPQLEINPRKLDGVLRNSTRIWWSATLSCKAIIFFIGISASFVPILTTISIPLILILSIATEIFNLRYSTTREMWDTIHRELEAKDSFGWPISSSALSDIMMQISKYSRQKALQQGADTYFTSNESLGPKRAIENLQESAWWSKHLARRTGFLFSAITTIVVITSVIGIALLVETVNNYNLLSITTKLIVSAIMIVFSLDLVRLSVDFLNFSNKSLMIEQQATSLIEDNSLDMVKAIKLMHEYQLARALGPMIPQVMFNIMRKDLHQMWRVYQGRNPLSK